MRNVKWLSADVLRATHDVELYRHLIVTVYTFISYDSQRTNNHRCIAAATDEVHKIINNSTHQTSRQWMLSERLSSCERHDSIATSRRFFCGWTAACVGLLAHSGGDFKDENLPIDPNRPHAADSQWNRIESSCARSVAGCHLVAQADYNFLCDCCTWLRPRITVVFESSQIWSESRPVGRRMARNSLYQPFGVPQLEVNVNNSHVPVTYSLKLSAYAYFRADPELSWTLSVWP